VGVYTETFIRTSVAGASVAWTVPAGKRAIVTYVTGVNYNGAAIAADVSIAAFPVFFFTLGVNGAQAVQMRCVAYAGQKISTFCAAANVYRSVNGYLFDDPGGGPPARARIERENEATPLPVAA
jgi:hypothetical protein